MDLTSNNWVFSWCLFSTTLHPLGNNMYKGNYPRPAWMLVHQNTEQFRSIATYYFRLLLQMSWAWQLNIASVSHAAVWWNNRYCTGNCSPLINVTQSWQTQINLEVNISYKKTYKKICENVCMCLTIPV